MVSVYVNEKFAWQLPKKLLSLRAPKTVQANAKENKQHETVNSATMRWDIHDFSQEAFRLFAAWLYNPRGRVKEPVADEPITPYMELAKFANRYEIDGLAPIVNKIVRDSYDNPQKITSMIQSYAALDGNSPDRASISARFAARALNKELDLQSLKPLIKYPELMTDIAIWMTLYILQGAACVDSNEAMTWMGENCEMWLETHESNDIVED